MYFNGIRFMKSVWGGLGGYKLENRMGEGDKGVLRINFDRQLRMKFHGVKVKAICLK